MRERLVELRPAQLSVEVPAQQRQIAAALLRQPFRIDLGESQLGAEAVARTRDQLRDRVLLQADDHPDLGVALVLELAQSEHEALARRQLRVGGPHLLLLAVQERAALRVVVDRRRYGRLGHLGDGLGPAAALDRLEEEVAQRREQVRPEVDGVRIEPVEPWQRPDEGLLDEVVRVVRVAGQPVGEPAQPRAVLVVQLLPGSPVAFPEPSDENGVSSRRRRRHDPSLGRRGR